MKTFAITISAISLLVCAGYKHYEKTNLKTQLHQIQADFSNGARYLEKIIETLAPEQAIYQQAHTSAVRSQQGNNNRNTRGNTAARPKSKYQGQYPEGSERKLVAKDVQYLTPWGKQVMINEIYARHGFIFRNGPIRNHFRRQKWYRGKLHNVDKLMTPVEKENLAFLRESK